MEPSPSRPDDGLLTRPEDWLPALARSTIVAMKTNCGLALSLVLTFASSGVARADDTTPAATSRPLVVMVKPLEPFVMRGASGPEGFSVDLWAEIARRNGWDYELRWVETVSEQLAAVAGGGADVAVAGISMTVERERAVDFSYPMFNAGLQIMTAAEAGQTSLGGTLGLIMPTVLRLLLVLFLVNLVVAHLMWLIERRRNPQFARGYPRGVWDAFWWSTVTLATVGYGDKTPSSVPGRVVGIFWMFTGIVLVANFTATITAQLTVRQFRGAIEGLEDLPGRRVATVADSTAAAFMQERGLRHRELRAVEDTYRALAAGEVDAVVFDAPVLLYHAATAGRGQVRMVGSIFKPETYGIALAPASPLREAVNLALLDIAADGRYQELYARWFTPRS